MTDFRRATVRNSAALPGPNAYIAELTHSATGKSHLLDWQTLRRLNKPQPHSRGDGVRSCRGFRTTHLDLSSLTYESEHLRRWQMRYQQHVRQYFSKDFHQRSVPVLQSPLEHNTALLRTMPAPTPKLGNPLAPLLNAASIPRYPDSNLHSCAPYQLQGDQAPFDWIIP